MKYEQWFIEQTTERQELSLKLMELSRNLGKANRNSDRGMIKRYTQELREIYQVIPKNQLTHRGKDYITNIYTARNRET